MEPKINDRPTFVHWGGGTGILPTVLRFVSRTQNGVREPPSFVPTDKPVTYEVPTSPQGPPLRPSYDPEGLSLRRGVPRDHLELRRT